MSETIVYEFIQGDDFNLPMTLTDPANNGTPVDITDWDIAAQVRYARKLIATLSVTITDPEGGVFVLQHPKEQTNLWPVRKLKCNIQFDRVVGGRISSKPFIIDCQEDPTKDVEVTP